MLNTTGADDTMKKILSGDLNADQIKALKTLVATPDKTLGMYSTASTQLYQNNYWMSIFTRIPLFPRSLAQVIQVPPRHSEYSPGYRRQRQCHWR